MNTTCSKSNEIMFHRRMLVCWCTVVLLNNWQCTVHSLPLGGTDQTCAELPQDSNLTWSPQSALIIHYCFMIVAAWIVYHMNSRARLMLWLTCWEFNPDWLQQQLHRCQPIYMQQLLHHCLPRYYHLYWYLLLLLFAETDSFKTKYI